MEMFNIFLFMLMLSMAGCGPGTTTGNPVAPVELRMEDKQPLSWLKKAWDSIIPPAYAAVSDIKFCFKRLRFKPDELTEGENFDLALGQVNINPGGTTLLTVSVPAGTYQEIEFDLDKDCDGIGKPSVSFTNNNGSFSTIDDMTIEFEGVYTVSSAGTLTLNIDPLLDALELVTADNQIATSLEAAPGDF